MNNGDNIAAGMGGVIMAVIGQVTFMGIAEVIVLSFVGGLVGFFAKKIGEWVWNFISKKITGK